MEVVDGLSAVAAGVEDGAIAAGEASGAGDFGGGPEQVAEQGLVVFAGGGHGVDVLAGNDEDVDGGLGMDVGKGVAELVLVDGDGGDGSFDDFAEEAIHGETSVHGGGRAGWSGRQSRAGREVGLWGGMWEPIPKREDGRARCDLNHSKAAPLEAS